MQKLFFMLIVLSLSTLNGSVFLSETEIKQIYKTYVKPNDTNEYGNRYISLPLEKNIRKWKWEGKDFPRVIALLEFERFVKEYNLTSKKGLAFNEIDPEWEILPHQEIVSIQYKDNPEIYDLHIINLDEKNFDFVMVNQTIEHIYDPITCLKNICKHMKKGGILYFNVPAMSVPHEVPFHFYTGITPTGVGALVRAAGFKILSIGQWGNLEYINKLLRTHGWYDYRHFKKFENQMDNPVITWVFAQKD